ncbi:MAG TPA: DUF3243 domain-containing protein [Sphingobacteriaceae bacterium]|nr:DUF3243 domain-containing protein [Sphingobacteriaceae bacterium]
MPVTNTFDQFTNELADRLQAAKKMGMSTTDISRRAADIGDWLSQQVEVKSPEQRVLKELWSVADEREQQAIASTMVKMVERHHPIR